MIVLLSPQGWSDYILTSTEIVRNILPRWVHPDLRMDNMSILNLYVVIRWNLHFIHFCGRQKRISALRMTIFFVSVPLFDDSVKYKVKMSFSHAI